jgi:hypothetical protein
MEMLDYLEDDHRFSTKTFSSLDFLKGEWEPKSIIKPVQDGRTSISIIEPGTNEEILIEIPQQTILSKRSIRSSKVPVLDMREIKACDPITETKNLKTYTSYLIKYGSVEVRRRYSEFVKLVEKLKKEFGHKDFPTLPEKQYFGRFDQELITARMQGMSDFLKFCMGDGDIKAHKEFLLFIQK